MNRNTTPASALAALAATLTVCTGAKADPTPPPYERGAYLWSQAYDADLNNNSGYGDWLAYKQWLGVSALSAEVDPGWQTWWDCSQHLSWNAPWGTQQQRYGAALPTVVLGIGQMPWDPDPNASWDDKLAWEDRQWQLEAANDPETMAYFANYAQEIDNGAGGFAGFNRVIVRLGYEFDGWWNPFGNLNVMSNMPNNYIQAWRNIVTTMRANDPKHIIQGFFWNPTDGNVQVYAFDFYPGDDWVDYIGFDEYDYAYNSAYPVGTDQPTQAQQDTVWNDVELPRINAFADFARAHNNKPLIVGEWGLWQLNDQWHPSGGDNPSYIQRMHDWMGDPNNHVAMEVYFETPSDGDSQLWPGGANPSWAHSTAFPNASALYRTLFSDAPGSDAPEWYSLTPGPGSVFLSWIWPSGASTFNIYRGTSPGGEDPTPIASGVSYSSWNDGGLTPGVRYYYQITSVNAAGESARSAEASAVAQ